MGKGKIEKVIGKISKEVTDRYKLYDYTNVDIVQSMDLYIHTIKHREEFKTIDNYRNAIFNVEKVIQCPDFVYYDKNKKSLQYLKKLDENVCVVVKLILSKNKRPYVATVYPINEKKINKLKELSYLNND